jgi:hypothetical protein
MLSAALPPPALSPAILRWHRLHIARAHCSVALDCATGSSSRHDREGAIIAMVRNGCRARGGWRGDWGGGGGGGGGNSGGGRGGRRARRGATSNSGTETVVTNGIPRRWQRWRRWRPPPQPLRPTPTTATVTPPPPPRLRPPVAVPRAGAGPTSRHRAGAPARGRRRRLTRSSRASTWPSTTTMPAAAGVGSRRRRRRRRQQQRRLAPTGSGRAGRAMGRERARGVMVAGRVVAGEVRWARWGGAIPGAWAYVDQWRTSRGRLGGGGGAGGGVCDADAPRAGQGGDARVRGGATHAGDGPGAAGARGRGAAQPASEVMENGSRPTRNQRAQPAVSIRPHGA